MLSELLISGPAYRETFGTSHVVGVGMATPIGLRYMPHADVARKEEAYLREAAGL